MSNYNCVSNYLTRDRSLTLINFVFENESKLRSSIDIKNQTNLLEMQ